MSALWHLPSRAGAGRWRKSSIAGMKEGFTPTSPPWTTSRSGPLKADSFCFAIIRSSMPGLSACHPNQHTEHIPFTVCLGKVLQTLSPFSLPGQGDLRNKGHLSHRVLPLATWKALACIGGSLALSPPNLTSIGANNALCCAGRPDQTRTTLRHLNKFQKNHTLG